MLQLRKSRVEDVPALKELWRLAFGDGEDYLENFFSHYYIPQYMLVLEEDDRVLAMTAWFSSRLVLPGEGQFSAAYLYAVATHPDHRGRGLASRLLDYAARYLKWNHGFQALTTVPARPDLHPFFGKSGFRECFTQSEHEWTPGEAPAAGGTLRHVSAEVYQVMREELLADIPHVAWDLDGITYQEGCCRISGGGLYRFDRDDDFALICLEGDGAGTWYTKELLGGEAAAAEAAKLLPTVAPGTRYLLRRPLGDWQFGMLKWLSQKHEEGWDWNTPLYLGPAFD